MAFLASLEGDRASRLAPGAQVFSALGQPVLVHGARPARGQVHSSGPWDDPSRQWSAMPVSSRAPAASILVVPHASHRLWLPEPLRNGRGSDAACRHGLIWDHTVFHVVPNRRASPKIVAPSKRNCRIAQRIARAPRRAQGAHTFSLCSRNVTVWQVRSRHIQRRIVPPEPHRNPGPRRVDHLHHHAPVTLSKSPHPPTNTRSPTLNSEEPV